MSTIYRVAEMAGVSPATVSRVINKRAGVNRETMERVERALETMQFRPRWKAAPAKAVGVVILPHRNCLAFPYNSHIFSAACETFFAEGYSVQLIPCRRTKEALSSVYSLVTTHQVEGVLVLPFYQLEDVPEQIECRGIPHVAVGPVGAHTVSHHVSADDFGAGTQAMRYLWDLGHRRFGVVTATTHDIGHRARLDGMRAALQERGGTDTDILHREFEDIDAAWGESAAAEMLGTPDCPTAFIVTNSVLAQGFSRGCRKRGVRVPEHVSVLGFEDADELDGLDPPLTVLRQPTRRMGEQAARLLLAQLREEQAESSVPLPLTLMVRGSTAPPARVATSLLSERNVQ